MRFQSSILLIVICVAETLSQDVVDVATSLGLIRLAQAINDTGLYEEWAVDEEATLNLFGPTDEAFVEAENAGIIPDNLDEFRSVLTYHAISVNRYGLLTLENMKNDQTIETVNTGDSMRFNIYENAGQKVYSCNGAEIDATRADNMASNGLVQVIDKVLTLPPYTVYTLLENNDNFYTLLNVVNVANLSSVLDGEGNFTSFAPSDSAFSKIPVDDFLELLKDKEALTDTLLYHTLSSTYYNLGIRDGIQLRTMQGNYIDVDKIGTSVRLNGVATVVSADITVMNGVVHVIDTLMSPLSNEKKACCSADVPIGRFP